MRLKSTIHFYWSSSVKLIAIAIAFVVFCNNSYAQYSQNFNVADPLPAGWAQQNNSQPPGALGWFQGNPTVFAAQAGAANAYIAVNFNSTTGTNTISNWLFAPVQAMKNGDKFIFWTRAATGGGIFPDRLQVRMSTNGASTDVGATATSVGDFTTLLLDINPTYSTTAYPEVWTQYTLTISGLAAPVSGRIAFRYFVENGGPTGANSNYIGVDEVSYIVTTPCTGTPNPGNTTSSSNPACSGANFTLNVQNPSPITTSGLVYQWQSATAAGGPYTNVAGGTGATLTTSQTAATFYRVVVTCSTNSATATSTPLQVTMSPFTDCYCVSGATSTADEDIFNVTIGALNNNSTCASVGPGPGSIQNRYSNYRTLAPSSVVYGNMPFSVTIGTCGGAFTNSTAIWIDFNHNAVFDASERVFGNVGFGPHTESGTIVIPSTALPGVTAMRVINVETGNPAAITPCGTYTWGETEDYLISIDPCVPAAFTSMPASVSVSCSGNTVFQAAATGSFVTYRWEQRTSAAAPWTDVTNGPVISGANTNTLTLLNVPGSMSGMEFRALITSPCSATDFSSPPAILTVTPLVATVSPTAATICLGQIQALTLTNPTSTPIYGPPSNLPTGIPDASLTGTQSTINVSNVPGGAVVNSVSVTFSIPDHTYAGDLIIVLRAPNGRVLNLSYGVNGTGVGPTITGGVGQGFRNTTISSAATNFLSTGTFPWTGTFRADARTVPAASLGNAPVAPNGFGGAALTALWTDLYSQLNGAWTIAAYDAFTGDVGTLTAWSLNIVYVAPPAQGVWTASPASPNTMFTDAAATVPYVAGTPVNTIYVKPTVNTSYSVVYSTSTPCVSGPTTVPVTIVNPVGAVTQPANRAVCLGGNAVFTVSAAGGPNSYQWQVSTDGGTNWTNISGATGSTLTVSSVTASMNNYRYRAVISAPPCAATVNSNAAILTVNNPPAVTLTASRTTLTPGQSSTLTVTSNPAIAANGVVWTLNGATITGTGATQTVGIDRLGDYRASVTDVNGCVAQSSIVNISASPSDRLWIYPNPSPGTFQVRLFYGGSITENRTVSVFNSSGQLIAQKEFVLTNTTNPYLRMDFDLSKMADGPYVVKVHNRNNEQIATGLVILQRD